MSITLDHLLTQLRPFLDDPATEEVCVNGPGNVFVYARGRFTRHEIMLDADEIEDIAIVAAAQRDQDVGRTQPLLGTNLPGIGRIQVVLPPCVVEGRPSLTIRKGADFAPTIDGLAEGGLFTGTTGRRGGPTEADARLLALYRAGDWQAFLRAAVQAKKTIVACGRVASGKTTLAKALCDAIDREERLITVEDTPEWTGLAHENLVQLYYSEGGQDGTGVTAAHLVKAALRMRPSRILLQELRDGASTLAFLHAVQSGHPGGITTVHSPHAEAAFDRLRILIKSDPAGAAISDADVMAQLRSLVDVVVHCERDGDRFWLSEVWFNLATQPQEIAA